MLEFVYMYVLKTSKPGALNKHWHATGDSFTAMSKHEPVTTHFHA